MQPKVPSGLKSFGIETKNSGGNRLTQVDLEMAVKQPMWSY